MLTTTSWGPKWRRPYNSTHEMLKDCNGYYGVVKTYPR